MDDMWDAGYYYLILALAYFGNTGNYCNDNYVKTLSVPWQRVILCVNCTSWHISMLTLIICARMCS